ncbi:sigma-54 interaction domain-containing protein [Fundidesulfovibrio terrae]|uniref:sigma-54 interaction domain-containing protein n=1 Tax=Fundidesulfovibrio terrae TaxID=2922866 RepID=UPI001FAF4ED6|nr:sigma-54 dependent transcriptional regulator [Fundidesulfovibrio terrae]
MPHSISRIGNFNEIIEDSHAVKTDLLVLHKTGNTQLSRLLPRITSLHSPPKVLVIVDKPDIVELEFALREGVLDYIQRDNAIEHLQGFLGRLDTVLSEEELSWSEVGERFNIHGSCPQIRKCLKTVAKASQSDVSVLIHGDTGTGKELFARAIHGLSRRKNENLIVVDCASLPANLVESILFGYSKGAFTGASAKTEGLVARAHNGTLFLDEVSELPMELQKKFLRVLQERRFRPVGAKREVESDFRLVAATNKDLGQMVKEGLFRDDLLYRLQSLKLNLPALSERREDLSILANHLLQKSCEKNRIDSKTFSNEFLEILSRHDWPGNVRELENVIDSVVAVSHNYPIIYPEQLPFYIRVKAAKRSMGSEQPRPAAATDQASAEAPQTWTARTPMPSYKTFRNEALDTIEKQYFRELHRASQGDVAKAMSMANLSRARLYEFYKKYKLTRGNNRDD